MKRCRDTGKVMLPSREAAIMVQKRTKNRLLNAFLCRGCGSWHNGRSRDPLRNSDRIGEVLRRHERDRGARSPSGS